jgi:hypothetical protein
MVHRRDQVREEFELDMAFLRGSTEGASRVAMVGVDLYAPEGC